MSKIYTFKIWYNPHSYLIYAQCSLQIIATKFGMNFILSFLQCSYKIPLV